MRFSMKTFKISQSQEESGQLRVDVTDELGRPITGATADISYTGNPNDMIDELQTDSNGQTSLITLPTPPLSYSESPGENQPYSEYNIRISAPGFAPVSINGAELFSGQTSIQSIRLIPIVEGGNARVVIIPPNVLNGNYPPKIPEAEIKPVTSNSEIVLNEVVVPETIVVHDGVPNDTSATNYYVPFTDYIKNVASSEIYPTWPVETLKANIIAIISFTLNRVYTEWYLRIILFMVAEI